MPLRLLVTSGGSLVGHNILEILRDRRDEVRLIATTNTVEEPRLYRYDEVRLVPLTADRAAFAAAVEAEIDRSEADLVVAARDEDVAVLAGLRARRADLAPRITAGAPEAAEILLDKLRTHAFAQDKGLPFVDTAAVGENGDLSQVLALVERQGFPVIAKPREGFGSVGVRIIQHVAQIEACAPEAGLIFQPMIEGAENLLARLPDLRKGMPIAYSFPENESWICQANIAPNGEIRAFQQIARHVLGRGEYFEASDDPDFAAAGDAFARAFRDIGWVGPLNMQFKRAPDGRFLAYELNGRFTGGTWVRSLMGFPEFDDLVEMFLGPGRLSPFVSGEPPRRIYRTALHNQGLDEDGRATLERDGVWHRA